MEGKIIASWKQDGRVWASIAVEDGVDPKGRTSYREHNVSCPDDELWANLGEPERIALLMGEAKIAHDAQVSTVEPVGLIGTAPLAEWDGLVVTKEGGRETGRYRVVKNEQGTFDRPRCGAAQADDETICFDDESREWSTRESYAAKKAQRAAILAEAEAVKQ